MTRTRKYVIDPETHTALMSDKPAINHPDFGDLYELSTTAKSKDVHAYINTETGKYYASWYSPDYAEQTPIKEVASVWVQNVLLGNVSFIDPIISGNDKSGESYNLGEFEALHRRMEWEVQKTTYWRKEAESRQRHIENLNLKLKRQKKDLNGLLFCVILVLISTALIVALK